MLHARHATLALALTLLITAGCASGSPRHARAPLWDLDSLFQTPAAEWGPRRGNLQEVRYEGAPLGGKPTRVFAYLARPEGAASAPVPAMVLVHGGGGKAFPEWAEHWASRGYVALAMDLAGNGPDGRLPDGGPDQSDAVKFRDFDFAGAREMWSYHAVAAVIRGHSLLRSLPEVDARRIGVTGISWGGYLTCIVAGLDSRFQVAVPVYGCGFLGENSVWKDHALAAMSPAARELWLELFDPSRHVGQTRCPILFLNGTKDFAYPLDSYQKTYRLVPERYRTVCVVPDLPHGHIWSFREVDEFVDSVLRGAPGLPKAGATSVSGDRWEADVRSPLPIREASLCVTRDEGPWTKRNWELIPAEVRGGKFTASFSSGDRPVTAAFFTGTDTRGLRFSSEHFAPTSE